MSIAAETVRGEVTIRNLSKSYAINGRHLTVLHGVNNHIRAGESLAIVGASGSGKTTLLRVLAGLENADRGEVLIDGQPVKGVGADTSDRRATGQRCRGRPRCHLSGTASSALAFGSR